MGWSVPFRHFTFPLLEILRPIPILAWVPLSILMFKGFEAPVIFLATLASLFVTTLNTMPRCAVHRRIVLPRRRLSRVEQVADLPSCRRARRAAVRLHRFADQHRGGVVLLVAAEMVSGDWGLGYLIVDAYMNNVTVPMVIGMVTLGFVGWGTSIVVRFAGNRMMQWRTRALALEGR